MGLNHFSSKILVQICSSNLRIFRSNVHGAAILKECPDKVFEEIHGNLNSGSINEGLNNMAR